MQVRVTLLQSAQTILTQFDADLAKKALDNLARTGVDVRTGVRVVEVTQKLVGGWVRGGSRGEVHQSVLWWKLHRSWWLFTPVYSGHPEGRTTGCVRGHTPPSPAQVILKGGERLDYGLCIWSAGNASRPLVQTLVAQIPEQVGYI